MKIGLPYLFCSFLALVCLFQTKVAYTQDTSGVKFIISNALYTDSINFPKIYSYSIFSDSIRHDPGPIEAKIIRKYKKLLNVEPSAKNHEHYMLMAKALWEIRRLEDAEKMFLKIVNSTDTFYKVKKYYASDIPRDTTVNTYGYGSCVLNKINTPCIYLAKIYIEKKEFEKAFRFLDLAENKYPQVYNCGTGYHMYHNKIEALYGLTYEGLGRCDSVLNMYLPMYNLCSEGPLIRCIKKTYSGKEIQEILHIAENSIVCDSDSFQVTIVTTENYGKPNEISKEIAYTTCGANLKLFGKEVKISLADLHPPYKVNRELFVKEFRNSQFYKALRSDL